MKRSKLSAGEQGRRARLQTSTAEDSDPEDPIAAAAQAKKAREEARIKAAAEAAAKAFAGMAKTVFYDNKGAHSSASATPDKAPSASKQIESTANPLAAILGYEQDDSASEDGSEPPSPRHFAGPAPHTPDVNGNSEADKTGDEDDPMLASFMSELESSGLLDKEPEQTSPLSPPRVPTQDPTPSTSTLDDAHMPDGSASPSTGVGPDGHEAAEANLAATIVNAVTDNQPEVPKQSGAPEQHRADAAGAAAAGSEAAEQRVLGDLEGAPTWREVMDMASGKVYFWDSATDEVAWEAPLGTQPRSKHDNAATFAAHVSPADSTTAGTADTAGKVVVASGSADHARGPLATSSDGVQAQDAADSVAAAAAATVEGQVASTSDGSPGQTGTPSGEQDREDGQLAQLRSASPSPATEQPPQLPEPPVPDSQLGEMGQQVVDQIRQSTHRLCRNIPQLVRLAVEAEVRLQDWQMFSTKQQRAVELSQAQAAVSWTDVQDHLRWRWQSITAALPAAQQEAQQLHTRMDQELEAGEMPPLPSDDNATTATAIAADAQLPSDQPEAPAHVANPAETTLLKPASAAAISEDKQSMPASECGEDGEAIGPSEAPPLPAEDPTCGPIAAPVVGAVSSTGAAAAADDDGADMELDMDVDASTDASQPALAESTGKGTAAASSAALPDWAGYYMAHGYTYPYYGQAASVPSSTSQTAADTSAQPSQGAASTSQSTADLVASHLATSIPSAVQAGSPAPQLPVPLKKKQYKAEPAPSSPSPTDGEVDAAAEVAAVGVYPSSVAEKQAQEADVKKRKRPKAPVGLGQLAAKKKKGTKGISSMIDKWQAVRKEEEDEQAKAEEELDPAVQERKRLEQAEKWRLQQLKAGASSEENANFQPLSVDWREKLKANRKATSKSAPSPSSPDSASPSPATASAQAAVTADLSMAADGKPNLEVLSKGLPAGWRAMWDKNSGDIYYGNLKTRTWSKAASTALPAQNNLSAIQRYVQRRIAAQETSWDRPR